MGAVGLTTDNTTACAYYSLDGKTWERVDVSDLFVTSGGFNTSKVGKSDKNQTTFNRVVGGGFFTSATNNVFYTDDYQVWNPSGAPFGTTNGTIRSIDWGQV